ncbi:hypothetical protein P3T27_007986 [Kitasatospora sp. MAA19]|uniref:hypothetical protein n=1 Tax=unclassified Kitasatospora TaxID=2633591 RepID=UPI0024765CE7|nr:hypothetical protein [Kitasatospora sp. MAA19]MDH6711233.1 hypothetical protein [Kitasatospora sp. MAA19]
MNATPLKIVAGGSDQSDRLAELLESTSLEARRRRLEATTRPVLPALAPLLPDRLPRGAAVEVIGDRYLLMALAAGAVQDDPTLRTALVGLGDLGIAAFEGLGQPLDRLAVADDPGPHWAEVVSLLAREGAFGVVLLQPTTPATPRQIQRLHARLREHGTTLLVASPWHGAALRLTTSDPAITGLGDGWGAIASRTVTAHCTIGTRTRSLRLQLPGPDGTAQPLAAAEPTARRAATA